MGSPLHVLSPFMSLFSSILFHHALSNTALPLRGKNFENRDSSMSALLINYSNSFMIQKTRLRCFAASEESRLLEYAVLCVL
ncbi:hypothetical protein IWZ01DRAFT_267181 [Phyllosticta capitalensis]